MMSLGKNLLSRSISTSTTSLRSPVSSNSNAQATRYASSMAATLEGKHFMSIDQLSNEELRGLLDLSKRMKEVYRGEGVDISSPKPKPLANHSVTTR